MTGASFKMKFTAAVVIVALLGTLAVFIFAPGLALSQGASASRGSDDTSLSVVMGPVPYDLTRIVQRALAQHFGVKVAQLQYAAAEERLVQQRSALRPGLTVGLRPHWFETPVPDLEALDADKLRDALSDIDLVDCLTGGQCVGLDDFFDELNDQLAPFSGGVPQKLQEGRGHNITLTGRVPMWRSPLQRAISRAAGLQLQHADVEVEAAAAGAIMQSIDAYFGVLRADKAVRIAELALQEAELRAAEMKAKVTAGTATRVDQLQVDAERYGAQAQLVQARGEVTVARMTLNSVLGLDLDVPLHLESPLMGDESATAGPALWVVDAIPTLNEALLLAAERADVRRARTDWELAQASATIAHEQAQPSVQLFGTYKWPNVELTFGIDRHGYVGGTLTQSETFMGQERVEGDLAHWAAGIELSWDLADGGERRAKVEEARLQVRQAEMYYEHVRQTAQTEVLAAHTSLKAAEQALIGAGQGVEAAAEAVQIARDLAAAGAATEVAVVRAQLALARAEQAYFEGLYAATMAGMSYMQAAGVLVDYWLHVTNSQGPTHFSWQP